MAAPLSSRLLDALEECGRYTARGSLYWWRQASMKKLEGMGLVEPYNINRKRRPYRLTLAGRELLRGFPAP